MTNIKQTLETIAIVFRNMMTPTEDSAMNSSRNRLLNRAAAGLAQDWGDDMDLLCEGESKVAVIGIMREERKKQLANTTEQDDLDKVMEELKTAVIQQIMGDAFYFDKCTCNNSGNCIECELDKYYASAIRKPKCNCEQRGMCDECSIDNYYRELHTPHPDDTRHERKPTVDRSDEFPPEEADLPF